MGKISVIVEKNTHEEDAVLSSRSKKNSALDTTSIPAKKLSTAMQAFSADMSKVFGSIQQVGDFHLEEVTLQVEISSEGGISLIGTAKAGLKGAITLKFKPGSNSMK